MKRNLLIITLVLSMMICLTGCMNGEQKKTIDELTVFMESKDNNARMKLQDDLKTHTEMEKWADNNEFKTEVFELIKQNFSLEENDNKCALLLEELGDHDYQSYALRSEYQELLNEKGKDLESKLSVYEIAQSSGWYGKELELELTGKDIKQYDSSTKSVEEIMDLNDRIGIINRHFKIDIEQSNIDVSIKNADFIEKVDLWKKVCGKGYHIPCFITKEDIDEFTSSHSEPIYTEKGKGGFYDVASNQTLKYKKDDITTYKGEAGFLTISNIKYFGDFAMASGSHTYVDSNDYYKNKTIPYFRTYFRNSSLDVELEDFQNYKEFVYSTPYLFAASKDKIDVFDIDSEFASGEKVLSISLN